MRGFVAMFLLQRLATTKRTISYSRRLNRRAIGSEDIEDSTEV